MPQSDAERTLEINRIEKELRLVERGRKRVADLLRNLTEQLTECQRTCTPLKQQGFYLDDDDLLKLQNVVDKKTVTITELRSQIAALQAEMGTTSKKQRI